MDEVTFRRRSKAGSQNLRAGYVPVDEEYLQQTGIRGKRSCCLAIVIVTLLLVAVINAMVTAGLVYFLSITHKGMDSVEFAPGGQLVRVLTDCYVDSVTTLHGLIGGRSDRDLEITGEKVDLNLTDGTGMSVSQQGISIHSNKLQLRTPTGPVWFSLQSPGSRLSLPAYIAANMHGAEVELESISSREGYSGLNLEAMDNLDIVGNEGVSAASEGEITLEETVNIHLNPVEGNLVLDAADGISVGIFHPGAGKRSTKPSSPGGFKLCVCMPSGKVFAVPVLDNDSGCHRANEDNNPCND